MKYTKQLIFIISTTNFCLELELPHHEQPVMQFEGEIKYTTQRNKIAETLVFQAGYEIVTVGLQNGINLKSLNALNTDEKSASLLRQSALYSVCQHARSKQNDLSFILMNDGKNDVFKDIKTIKQKRIPAGWKQGSVNIHKVTPRWIS